MQLVKCPQCEAFHLELNAKCPACGAENLRSAQWSEEAKQKFWAANPHRWEITKITMPRGQLYGDMKDGNLYEVFDDRVEITTPNTVDGSTDPA